MGVPEKTNRRLLIGETRDGIEAVEDVTPLLRRIEGRVDDREIAHLPGQGQVAQPFLVFVRSGARASS